MNRTAHLSTDENSPVEDAARIRAALREPDLVINMSCFNNTEAEAIAAHLTRDELGRVRWRWRFTVGSSPLERSRFVPPPKRECKK